MKGFFPTVPNHQRRQVNILWDNGVTSSLENLANKTCPLSRPFFTVTQKEPSVPVQKFIAFMPSKEGRKILADNGNLLIN